MALNAGIEWDIQTGGSDSNGGGFKAGASGTDRSLITTPQATLTVLSVVHTTTTQINVSVVDYTVSSTDVGNVLQVTGGSATADFYEITVADVPNNRWTCDKAVGTAAQTVVGRLGGCLLTLSKVEPKAIGGNTIHVKNGTYAELLTLTISAAGGSTLRRWVGYNSTHGDITTFTNGPTIDAAGARASCIAVVATTGNEFSYFKLTGGTAANYDQTTGFSTARQCKSSNSSAEGFRATTTGALAITGCESASNGTLGVNVTGSASLIVEGCYIHDNTTAGVAPGTGSFALVQSIVEANGSHGFSLPVNVVFGIIDHCTVDGNTGATTDGLNIAGAGSRPLIVRNNLFTNNGRYGANRTGPTTNYPLWNYNDYIGNGTAGLNSITAGAGDSTADPGYTNRGAGDFTIATTLADAGSPGAFPGATTTGFTPMGAVGRSGAASGGGMLRHPGMEGGTNA